MITFLRDKYRWNLIFLFLGIPLCFLFPLMVQYGIFFNGLAYSSIALNLSEFSSSLWSFASWPQGTVIKHLPPLTFWFQNALFSLLGNHYWIESLYGLLCFSLVSMSFFAFLKLFKDEPSLKVPWSLFFLFLLPLFLWSMRNNSLENTAMVFTTWAVFFQIKYSASAVDKFFFWGSLASFFLVGAFWSGGYFAFFPFLTPLFYGIFFDSSLKRYFSFLKVFLPGIFVFLLFLWIWQNNEAKSFLKSYHALFKMSFSKSFFVDNMLLFYYLIRELVIPFSFLMVVFFFFKEKLKFSKVFFFYLLLAFSSFFPCLFYKSQASYILILSFPFFCLAFQELFSLSLVKLELYLKNKIRYIFYVNIILFLVSFSFIFLSYKKIYKNEHFYESFLPIMKQLPSRDTYGVCQVTHLQDQVLAFGVARYKQSGVISNFPSSDIWILKPEDSLSCIYRKKCQLLNDEKSFYRLYHCPL